jgi:hypothetical protein
MSQNSLFDRQIPPYVQLGGILLLSVILMLLSKLAPTVPYASTAGIMPWVVLCGMILFFALINSILSFSATDGSKYWMQSVFSFGALLIIGGILAWAISGVSINEAGSVRWIYFVLTFGYLVFLSIVNLIKFFVALARRQDSRLRGEE